MFTLGDLIREWWRSLFTPTDEWDDLLEMKQQRDEARAALAACREHKSDILARSIALAMRLEFAEDEAAKWRRVYEVMNAPVPKLPGEVN
jgi:hypothetical protein